MFIPQTSPYRQGILQAGVGEHKLIRRVASGHEYAHVRLRVEPLKNGGRFEFSEEVTACGSLPARFLSHVEIGALKAADEGLWGFPLDSFRVCVVDGSYHEIDSTPLAFEEASRLAFVEAMAVAQPVIAEPWDLITVRVAANCAAAVTRDLTAHRGEIRAIRPSTWFEIDALLPGTEFPGYFSAVAWNTSGSGTYSIAASEFKQVPDALIVDFYCAVCARTMRMPLVREEPFSGKCLVCGSPFRASVQPSTRSLITYSAPRRDSELADLEVIAAAPLAPLSKRDSSGRFAAVVFPGPKTSSRLARALGVDARVQRITQNFLERG